MNNGLSYECTEPSHEYHYVEYRPQTMSHASRGSEQPGLPWVAYTKLCHPVLSVNSLPCLSLMLFIESIICIQMWHPLLINVPLTQVH